MDLPTDVLERIIRFVAPGSGPAAECALMGKSLLDCSEAVYWAQAPALAKMAACAICGAEALVRCGTCPQVRVCDRPACTARYATAFVASGACARMARPPAPGSSAVPVTLVAMSAIPRHRLSIDMCVRTLREFTLKQEMVLVDDATTMTDLRWRCALSFNAPAGAVSFFPDTGRPEDDMSWSPALGGMPFATDTTLVRDVMAEAEAAGFFAIVRGDPLAKALAPGSSYLSLVARPATFGALAADYREGVRYEAVGRRIVGFENEGAGRADEGSAPDGWGDDFMAQLRELRALQPAPVAGRMLVSLEPVDDPPPPELTDPNFWGNGVNALGSGGSTLFLVDDYEQHPDGEAMVEPRVRLDRGGGWRTVERDGSHAAADGSLVGREIVAVIWAEWRGGRPLLSGGAHTAAARDAASTGVVFMLDDGRALYGATEASALAAPAYVGFLLANGCRRHGQNGLAADAWRRVSVGTGVRRRAARSALDAAVENFLAERTSARFAATERAARDAAAAAARAARTATHAAERATRDGHHLRLLDIQVRDLSLANGSEQDGCFFRVSKTTRLGEVFGTYAERKGYDLTHLWFTLPGSAATLSADDAAGRLADGATIEAYAQPDSVPALEAALAARAAQSFTLKVRNLNHDGAEEDVTFFKIKTTTRLGKLFGAYAEHKGFDLTQLRFSLPGSAATLSADDDAAGLVDGDMIDARVELQPEPGPTL